MKTPVFAQSQEYIACVEIIRTLRDAGHEAYIAGGAVRDALLGRPQKDLDITSSALPAESRELFRNTIPVGESFGVLIIRLKGCSFELATFREESDYRDGRHPEQVRFSNAKADVFRRDFTINGMLWDPVEEVLHDWVGGQEDLEAQLIRTIGPAGERFAEDHLRMLRALRFSAQLNFRIDDECMGAVKSMASRIQSVSMERIEQELDKLFETFELTNHIDALRESGLLETIFGKLRKEARKLRTRMQLPGDAIPLSTFWMDALASMELIPDKSRQLAIWAAFLLDSLALKRTGLLQMGQQEAGGTIMNLARGLRVPREQMTALSWAVKLLVQLNGWTELGLAGKLRLLRHPCLPAAERLAQACPGFPVPQNAELLDLRNRYSDRWHPEALLSGQDLQEQGVSHGPRIGEVLFRLESEQLEGRIETREAALAWLRATYL